MFKEILDANSQQLSIADHASNFKTVDCKLLHNIFNDLSRAKTMAKVKNDQYIFLERSDNILNKSKQFKGGIQRLEPQGEELESRRLEKL